MILASELIQGDILFITLSVVFNKSQKKKKHNKKKSVREFLAGLVVKTSPSYTTGMS